MIRAINDAIEAIDPELGGISGGDFDDWSFSVKGIWSLNGASANGLYLLGGIGIDRVEAKWKRATSPDRPIRRVPRLCH